MTHQTEQLEREAAQSREQLAESLEELRYRITPGNVVDQLIDYASKRPAAVFLRKLASEFRESRLSLLLLGASMAGVVLSQRLSARARRARRNNEREIIFWNDAGLIRVCTISTRPEPKDRAGK
jgi:uncharacterized protein DUF3618